mmetsp:Transcript_12392/g.17689  ORF Transcript_12392/g.17689 Transcript_12392/m.17689 type:complete len:220 (+) Transcript_12392:156-815(+)
MTVHRSSPSPPRSNRRRLDSKEIPRTYSGLYGEGGSITHETANSDLLPFELSRNRNTEFLKGSPSSLLAAYVVLVVMIALLFVFLLPFEKSWTFTNILHGLITMVYLHWIKGSPDFYGQGELNAMTWWEQISSAPPSDEDGSRRGGGGGIANAQTVLFIVPTILCHLACHFCAYDKTLSAVNVFVWAICVIAKLELMNGVRLLGINSTTGIDDDMRKHD